jgi:hypothetical protein
MLKAANIKPRVTGDTWPIERQLTDASGTPIDITGYTGTLVVDANENPAPGGGTNLFTLSMVIVDATQGRYHFIPTQPQANLLVRLPDNAAYWAWEKLIAPGGASETAKMRLPIASGPG